MFRYSFAASGRHFLQIPGPANVPDRILRAMDHPTIDHRGPEVAELAKTVLAGIKDVFRTRSPVIIYPSSGTGAWEAALVNTLSPGDQVLMFETGQFATLWQKIALKLGLAVEFVPGDWRHGVDLAAVEARLAADTGHAIKAVLAVHNETSTGVTSRIAEVRAAIDRAGHPALFMVDTVSGLGSIDYRHDEWGIDVSVSGSQKGLMLPPGLGFNALSDKALAASKTARLPRLEPRLSSARLGRSTEQAMQLGAQWGYRGMVREILAELRKTRNLRDATVCLTGGYGLWLARGWGEPVVVDPDLTLRGIGRIYDLNFGSGRASE